jgi:hypothetical protein
MRSVHYKLAEYLGSGIAKAPKEAREAMRVQAETIAHILFDGKELTVNNREMFFSVVALAARQTMLEL